VDLGAVLRVVCPESPGDSSPRRRFAITFVFGLVHRLGFADAMRPPALAGWSLVGTRAGFNPGAGRGQVIAIGLHPSVMLVIGRLE
jgi:hypothetical protein